MPLETSSLSPRDAALEIMDGFKARLGIDLAGIAGNEALTVEQRRRKMIAKLLEATLSGIDEYHRAEGIELASHEDNTLITAALAEEPTEIEPNISLTQHNFEIVRGYRGQEVTDYVYGLSKRLEAMQNAKTPGQLAIEIGASSLFSIGVAMAKLTWTAWRGGATFLNALRTGITTLGMKTAITIIVIVLVAFLLYLFLENPKKVLALVFNDTAEDLVVTNWRAGVEGGTGGNLYVAHGHMENFMQDHASGDLDSPIVQIRQRFFFEPNDPDNVVFGGIYFADRNFGLRGSEGVMLFTSLNSPFSAAHLYAVPYVNDNGTNMRLMTGQKPNLETLFREMYDTRKVRVDFAEGGYRFTSTVNDARGGVVGLIGTISKT
ncbi:MAG: hypothetical protein V4522_05025 [Pseudomonadota bacterium]